MQKVHFYFHDRSYALKDRRGLKKAISSLFGKEKTKLTQLTYVFCSDEYLLEINKTYLKHNYYTDIITFDLSDTQNSTTGEIYISIDRVKENAKNLGVSMREELCRVLFHGALHLCGYSDKSQGEQKLMRKKEDHYISRYL